jgi:hypothetical protein
MEDVLKLVTLFKEPALMVAILGLVAMSWVNYQMFKILDRRDKVIESLATEVAAGNVSMAKLVVLVDILVHGRRD